MNSLFKKNKFLGFALFFSLLFLCFSIFTIFMTGQVFAANWQTLETDNFYVHYPLQLEDEAVKSAEIAEEVHEELIQYYQYEKQDKTHLIVKDDSDIAAGVTTPYLLDSIEINLSHPLRREFGSSFASWLKVLIAHEYAHVLHLNLRAGGSEAIRRIFGRVPGYTYPNMFQPYWMLEGYAIMAESMLTEGGRADDSVYDMYMRTSFNEDALYHFDQIQGQYNLESWPPGGQSVYIYGAAIFDYLVEEYGKENLIEVSNKYSENPGRGISSAFEAVYEQNVTELYEEWLQRQEEEYRARTESLKEQGIIAGYHLTEVGHQVHQPSLIPGEENIIYYHTGNKFPGLRIYDLETERDYTLTTGIMASTGFSFDSAGNLIFSQLNQYDHERRYFDLYKYDFEQEDIIQLTEGARAHSPVVTAEDEVIYITRDAGDTKIVKNEELLTENNSSKQAQEEVLLAGIEGEQFLYLSLSPDDESLALVSWQPGGYQDLFLYDIVQEGRERITRGKETVISPSWNETGEKIVFSADYDGIYNAYYYKKSSEEIFRITNEITGAFDPIIINDNGDEDGWQESSLVYTGYSSRGYDLYQMPVADSLDEITADLKNGRVELETSASVLEDDDASPDSLFLDEQSGEERAGRDYNVMEHIYPRYFFPSLFFSTGGGYAGITFGGRDPRNVVHYRSTIEYDGWDFNYPISYDWNLELDLGRFDLLQQSSREAGRKTRGTNYYYQDEHNLQFLFPLWQDIFSQLRLGGGAGYLRRNIRDGGLEEIYQLYGIVDYLSQRGEDEVVNTRNLSLDLGSIYHMREQYLFGQFNWREFWEITGSHSLSLRAGLAWTELERGFEMGGLFGQYPVRGYRERFAGSQLYYLRGEYRYPFWKIKRGIGTSPIFFDKVSAALFLEGGEIRGEETEQSLVGFGGELTLDMEASYGRMPVQLNIGLAGNIDEPGMRFYISPGLTF